MKSVSWWHELFIGSDSLPAHGFCLLWNQTLISELVLGNLMVVIAYLIIPLELFLMLYITKGKKLFIPQNKLALLMFSSFIFCCGVSHALDIVVMYYPLYELQAHWLILTGFISLGTVATTGWTLKVAEQDKKMEQDKNG